MTVERPISEVNYDVLRNLANYIECPRGCEKKTITINLKEGNNLFIYCNACGTIIHDDRKEELSYIGKMLTQKHA